MNATKRKTFLVNSTLKNNQRAALCKTERTKNVRCNLQKSTNFQAHYEFNHGNDYP
jgi:hypothetical protein